MRSKLCSFSVPIVQKLLFIETSNKYALRSIIVRGSLFIFLMNKIVVHEIFSLFTNERNHFPSSVATWVTNSMNINILTVHSILTPTSQNGANILKTLIKYDNIYTLSQLNYCPCISQATLNVLYIETLFVNNYSVFKVLSLSGHVKVQATTST